MSIKGELHPQRSRAHAAQGGVTLGLEQGELGAVFPNLGISFSADNTIVVSDSCRASSSGALEQGHALCLHDSISAGKFMSSNFAIEPGEVEFAQCFLRAFEFPTIGEVYRAITF